MLVSKQDNRKFPRMQDDCDVLIYKENSLIVKAHTENCSECGVYLQTDGLLFPKDTSVKLVFSNEGSQEKPVFGKVVHRTLRGVGIEFERPLCSKIA